MRRQKRSFRSKSKWWGICLGSILGLLVGCHGEVLAPPAERESGDRGGTAGDAVVLDGDGMATAGDRDETTGSGDADQLQPACPAGQAIEQACVCDGEVHSTGWCCQFGFSDLACQPDPALYVRQGASGDGSDWANALGELPQTLTRGMTYVVADGEYFFPLEGAPPAYRFDDAAAGQERIILRKATATDHGTDVGWQAEYGDGQALFGALSFEGDWYVFDGRQPHGFKVVGGYQGLVIDMHGDHLQLRNCEIDGNFVLSGGYQTDGSCNGINIHGTDIQLSDCDIHNIADDGVGVYGRDIVIQKSAVHRLHGCGTDGGCGPCYNGHSDGLELQDTSNVQLIGNMVYDIKSTAALITGQWTAGNYTRDLVMANNIFYTPDTGLTVYLYYVQNAVVYNNIIWGRSQGARYGGLAIGPEMTGLLLHNNIILNLNYNHLGGGYDPTEHDIDYNLFAMLDDREYPVADIGDTNNVIADPLFAVIPQSSDMTDHITDSLQSSDFALTAASPAIDAGTVIAEGMAVDFTGQPRPLDGDDDGTATWDIGPFEYSP